ncbi:MAG: YaaC family protein [Humibacter sp.]
MAMTYYALGLMTAAESWRAIRTIRAEPQGQLDRVLRRDTTRRREFHMALEQSQQQFAAAERIGYESRPLNLFYGLSQAGRAIAAGSNLLGPGTGQQWQATGHGLQYDVSIPRGVFATPITQEGSGKRDLFSRVSTALDSPSDVKAVDFGAAVNQLLDHTIAFQKPEGYPRPIMDVRLVDGQGVTFPRRLEVAVPGLTRGSGPAEVLARRDVEHQVAAWVHWYNTQRLHSYIGHLPPIEFEHHHRHARTTTPIPEAA